MDERIVKFLKKMHLASVCTIDDEGQPYAFSAFYAFDERERCGATPIAGLFFRHNPREYLPAGRAEARGGAEARC